jgi:glycosyltransferase involved in cell wall biosynthesis
VDVVVGTHALGLGGSETYAITLADHLQRLGHRVVICATGIGRGEKLARACGVEVVALERYRGSSCDRIVAQDGATALELAARHPRAPLTFVAHSEEFDPQLPPQLADLAAAVIVLNGRVERRVRALAADLPIVRLTQPVDVSRFRPRTRPSTTPRRLLAFGNNLRGGRLELIAAAAEQAGLEVVRAGTLGGGETTTSELLFDDADIVMGYGRCVLEGMACGRPAYVYDHLGGDGWVTASSYSRLEEDGFGGRALPDAVDPDRIADDLRGYRPEMGLANRDLVIRHHRAEHHAQQVVELLAGLGEPAERRPDSLSELARLVRGQWAARARVDELETRVGTLAAELAHERNAHAYLRRVHDETVGSLRHRVGMALARPLDAGRAWRNRRR